MARGSQLVLNSEKDSNTEYASNGMPDAITTVTYTRHANGSLSPKKLIPIKKTDPATNMLAELFFYGKKNSRV